MPDGYVFERIWIGIYSCCMYLHTNIHSHVVSAVSNSGYTLHFHVTSPGSLEPLF